MSYSAPGPGREWFTPATKSEQVKKKAGQRKEKASKRDFSGGSIILPKPDQVQLASAGPPALRRLVRNEQRRTAARNGNRPQMADAALRDVIGDLDVLLATAETHVRTAGDRRSRRQLKKVVPELVTLAELDALPFDEVADFLGIPAAEADGLFAELVQRGGFSRADREKVLQQLRQLRKQLHQVEITRDHSLLDRLLGFIIRIALLVGIAVASTPLGALAVGDPVVSEAIKTGVIALVALALQQTVDAIRTWQTEQDPYVVARKAHTALLTEILAAEALTKTPAYQGEHAVLRFRLEVRCARARVASLPLEWSEKTQYWLELDHLILALDRGSLTTLPPLHRRLEALTPPPS